MTSFEAFLQEHHEEIDALHFFYSQPYTRRLRHQELKELADNQGPAPGMDADGTVAGV